MKRDAAFAVFSKQEDVNRALEDLKLDGFQTPEFSVVKPTHPGAQDFGSVDNVTRVAQGAELGGGIGFIIGMAGGFLAGFGAVSLPFISELHVNPWAGAFVGGLFGLISGAGSGALVGIGTPASAADRYARYLDDGGIIVSVHSETQERKDRAMQILERNGGTDVTEENERAAWDMVFSHSHNFSSANT